jgi:hypothetical protein
MTGANMLGTRPQNSAPVRVLKIPLSFFGLPSSSKADHDRIENHISRLKEALRPYAETGNGSGERVPQDLLDAHRAMPIALYRVEDEFQIPISCTNILWEHIYLLYYAYVKDPEAQPDLEKILAGYPEYVFHLLETNHRRRKAGQDLLPLRQTDVYYARQLLNGSPYWAIRWLKLNPSEQYYNQILYLVYTLRTTDAACAHCYHWLKTRNSNAEERIAEMVKILPVIATSPWYSFLIALEYPSIDTAPMIEGILPYPAWIYNWLRWVQRGPRDLLVDKLLTNAAWTVQYLADVNPPDAGEILERTKQKNRNPWWNEWLEIYSKK